jgi:transcriptional regulator with XRE-family HTH domain
MTGAELRRRRKAAGLSQRALAQLLDLHWNTVAGMEQGRVPIREVVALAVRYVTSAPQPKGGRRHER